MGVSFKLEGIGSVHAAFQELVNEIGDKNARSKILIPAVREAMKPVLAAAKTLAPKDTTQLANTLTLSARRPTNKDRKSKYITQSDTVIAIVTTKAFPKKKRQAFYEENKTLYESDKKAYAKKFKKFAQSINFPYDARAIAQEFGTARNPAHSFMRPALESQSQATVKKLGEVLARRINEYNKVKT
jgi:HK97 gp10 family phage protein